VTYTGRDHKVLRYACRRGRLDNGDVTCLSFSGISIDEAVSQQLLEVIQPASLEATVIAAQ